MKINELLIEAISLSSFSVDCNRAIKIGIAKTVFQYFKQSMRNQTAVDIILETNLETILTNLIQKKFPEHKGLVKFDEMPKASATAQAQTSVKYQSKTILISKLKFSKLSKSLFSVISSLSSDSELFSAIDAVSSFDKSVYDAICDLVCNNADISSVVSEFTTLITHEVTHLMQHVPQEDKIKSGKLDKFDYRHINGQQHSNHSNRYGDYLSVLQEIEAHAQEQATQILSSAGAYNTDFNNPEQVNNLIDNIKLALTDMQNSAVSLGNKYMHLQDKEEYSEVLKRFRKKLYQELNRFIEQVKENGISNSNRIKKS